MRLYFDRDLGKLVQRPGYPSLITSVGHKRGDGDEVEVSFHRGTADAPIGTPVEMVYVVKVDFGDETPALLLANTADWVLDGETGVWTAKLGSDGVEILAALAGEETAVFKAEFTVRDENFGPSTSQTLAARVSNDLWKGTEGTPLSLPTPEEWITARALLITPGQVLTLPEKANALSALGLPGLNTFDATAPPTIADDSTLGYSVGSLWIDVVGSEAYRCTGAAVDAAVWVETTLDAAEVAGFIAAAIAALGLGTASTSDVEDFAPAQALVVLPTNIYKLTSPLNTSVGTIVRISEEADRKERYLGDVSGDDVCGLYCDNAPWGYNSFFRSRGGSGLSATWYSQGGNTVYYNATQWETDWGVVAAAGAEDYPWLADWTGNGLNVSKNPVTAEENWEIVGENTYELLVLVTTIGGGASTVNGASVPENVVTSVGFVKSGQVIPVASPEYRVGTYVNLLEIDEKVVGDTSTQYYNRSLAKIAYTQDFDFFAPDISHRVASAKVYIYCESP